MCATVFLLALCLVLSPLRDPHANLVHLSSVTWNVGALDKKRHASIVKRKRKEE